MRIEIIIPEIAKISNKNFNIIITIIIIAIITMAIEIT